MSNRRLVVSVMCIMVCLILLFAINLPRARGDVAPPQTASGASISAGEGASTYVQMVAEQVELTVSALDPPPDPDWAMAGYMQGHVEATFLMRNQGEADESFDVWFPLTSGDEWEMIPGSYQVQDFQAWVDQEPVQVTEAMGRDLRWADEEVPWATWPVTFPVGQDVILRVAYDVLPVGYAPWGEFQYVLQTGGGWYGPIGQGTVTVVLPYQIEAANVQWGEAAADYGPESPFAFSVYDQQARWQFADWEPPEIDALGYGVRFSENNISLTVLAPSIWEAIEAARQTTEQAADDPQSWLDLAAALQDAVQIRYVVEANSTNLALTEQIDTAYAQAVALAPEDIDVWDARLDWWERCAGCEQGDASMWLFGPNSGMCFPQNVAAELDQADALVSEGQRQQASIDRLREYLALLDEASQEQTPMPIPPVPAPSEPLPTVTPIGAAPVEATDMPDEGGSTPAPASTPIARPVSVPGGLPMVSIGALVLCGLVALAVLGIGVAVALWAQRR